MDDKTVYKKSKRITRNFKRINNLNRGIKWSLLALFMIPMPALAQNVFNGTWKVDPGSYKTTMQVTFTLKNGVYRVQSTGQPAYHIKADGDFHKVLGQPGFDAESVRIINDHTVQTTREKNGKKIRSTTFSVNPNGKTGTFRFSSVNNGHTFKGKSILKRVAAGPAGSHAISGTWRMQRAAGSSSWTMTYKINGNAIDFHSSTGASYQAKLYGTETTVVGDEPGEKMSVVMLGSHKLREIYRVKDKIGNVSVTTVAKDGKTAKVVDHNLDTGNTITFTMTKQ
ncbi:MAG TPA: hypothetical protein VE870_13085 [Bacteroidales bacterium]|nr:hypothetical protein [Bacteroidales bacterium]